MILQRFALSLAFCSLAAVADDALPEQLPPEQESVALRAAETVGQRIHRHDQAAAVATDAVLKLHRFKEDTRIRGWVTQEESDRIVVSFIDQTPAALYRVPVSSDGVAGPVTELETPVALTPYESGAAAARAAALDAGFKPCSDRYNTVVLPASEAATDKWTVYVIPGTTRHDVVPVGGTYRMDVSGSEVVSQRAFTLSCVALQLDPKQKGFLMITHLLDPIPTEAHVFWSLWAGRPMFVASAPRGTIWGIENGRIALIERKSGED